MYIYWIYFIEITVLYIYLKLYFLRIKAFSFFVFFKLQFPFSWLLENKSTFYNKHFKMFFWNQSRILRLPRLKLLFKHTINHRYKELIYIFKTAPENRLVWKSFRIHTQNISKILESEKAFTYTTWISRSPWWEVEMRYPGRNFHIQ